MSVSLGCLVFASVLMTDTQGLPEHAKNLSLRQAFHVRSARGTWHHDFESARAESISSGLPLVMHFEAEWCSACKRMDREVLTDAGVRDELGRTVIGVKIDADHYPRLVERFHVAVLPCDVFVGVDGRLLHQECGPRAREQYLSTLQQVTTAAQSDNYEWEKVKLGKEALADLKSQEPCVIERHGDAIIGLGGFSPVAMTKSMKWARGSHKYAHLFHGVLYLLRDQAELDLFKKDPARYAPKLQGCDPVVFTNRGTPLPGKIQLGAFFEGSMYFFATESSRKLFKKNPSQYAADGELVRGADVRLAVGP